MFEEHFILLPRLLIEQLWLQRVCFKLSLQRISIVIFFFFSFYLPYQVWSQYWKYVEDINPSWQPALKTSIKCDDKNITIGTHRKNKLVQYLIKQIGILPTKHLVCSIYYFNVYLCAFFSSQDLIYILINFLAFYCNISWKVQIKITILK